MSGMHRRGFLGSVLALVVAPVAAVKALTPKPKFSVAFDPRAFALTMEPLSAVEMQRRYNRTQSRMMEQVGCRVYAGWVRVPVSSEPGVTFTVSAVNAINPERR